MKSSSKRFSGSSKSKSSSRCFHLTLPDIGAALLSKPTSSSNSEANTEDGRLMLVWENKNK
uniref:Uncharacterized protein n=1 Tax=Neogobius melanostomus TaxID=47308 RepID=A0A8C6WPW1_9GOBI